MREKKGEKDKREGKEPEDNELLRCPSRNRIPLYLGTASKIKLDTIDGHVLSARYAKDTHALVVFEAREQLGSDEEVLAGVLSTGDLDHALVHHPLVAWIHSLVDLVNHSERCLGHGLEGHQVEYRRHGALPAGLAVLVQLLKGFVFPVGFVERELVGRVYFL